MYMTINQQDTLNTLAFNIVHREREVHQYQINIDNYTQMLSTLPMGEAPEELLPYMGTKIEELPLNTPIEIIAQLADYQYRDRIAYLIRTEIIEQHKSKQVLSAMKAQIPADQLDALVAEALVIVNAQTPVA